MAQRTLFIFTLLVLLLASTEASRPLGSKAAALATVYQDMPAVILELSSTTRHLLKETKKPNAVKAARAADTVSRAFGKRMNAASPKRSSR